MSWRESGKGGMGRGAGGWITEHAEGVGWSSDFILSTVECNWRTVITVVARLELQASQGTWAVKRQY